MNGVGPETADSMLLYAAKKPVFVVDTYTFRIMNRHGLIFEEAGYEALQEIFMDNLPEDVGLFNEFHALIVQVGKNFCGKKLRCEECPLNGWEREVWKIPYLFNFPATTYLSESIPLQGLFAATFDSHGAPVLLMPVRKGCWRINGGNGYSDLPKNVSTSKTFSPHGRLLPRLWKWRGPCIPFQQPLLYGWMGEIMGDAFSGGNDANFGLTFSRNVLELDVLLPWCGTRRTSLSISLSVFVIISCSPSFSRSPGKRKDRPAKEILSTRE